MKIAGRVISGRMPPYVIAELGVNHDGSAARAVELTRAAARAGADAIKLQLFRTDLLLSAAAKLAAYQRAAGEHDPVSMLRRLELDVGAMAPVVEEARALGLHAIVTVFSHQLVAEACTLGWDAFKTASPDVINLPLLRALAATGAPIIVSTGASTMREVERAVGWLDAARPRLALLQCVSCYPTWEEDAGVEGIAALADLGVPVGYSDHTVGDAAACEAVRLGAVILEKHLTYDRGAQGPDHAASASPPDFAAYCRRVRAAWRDRRSTEDAGVPRGEGRGDVKRVLACEEDVRASSRQSLVATRDLSVGTRLTRCDLTIKRPGTGIAPYELDGVVGLRVASAVGADTPVRWVDLMERPAAGAMGAAGAAGAAGDTADAR